MSGASRAAGIASTSEHFGSGGFENQGSRIGALVNETFLTEIGFDAERLVLAPPENHLLLVRPVCVVVGCHTTAPTEARVCYSCRHRLEKEGLSDQQVELLSPPNKPTRSAMQCLVNDCKRERLLRPPGLCRSHLDQQRDLGVPLKAFIVHSEVSALPPSGPCLVVACTRQRRHPDGCYCEAHQIRLRVALRREPDLDEESWRAIGPAIGVGGEISLRGLNLVVVAEVLYGLQCRCVVERVKTKESDLRAFCDDLRRQQVASIEAFVAPVAKQGNLGYIGLANSLAAYARRALATPESEVAKDVWDLAVFGHYGSVSFERISQHWLKEATKRWAADDLPRRRIRPGRRTSGGLAVRHHVNCVVMLSESLRLREDAGELPGTLSRVDMEGFLNRLSYLVSAGRISGDARIRATREVRAVLQRVRAMGLTRTGQVAGGLGEDFAIHREDVPDKPDSTQIGRDVPPEVLAQLCNHLIEISSSEVRTGIELAIDTGRRPEEICDLSFDCLTRDEDGLAVLVFDNHKANRLGRRLPIGEPTAQVIVVQQQRVRSRFPDTPLGELKLLPTDRRNPDGRRAITAFTLGFAHREWVSRLPVLRRNDGTEFDQRRVVLYAYRHSYAQRHADAGVPIDVLRELMDHRKLDTTKGYYNIGEPRRRQAIEAVSALAFDRHGTRIWHEVQTLLDSEHARRAISKTAVPFGVCTEPSNVKAGGGACPFRFRCTGCDHFRTDVSYLPDLNAYLDDLLRNRERLLATTTELEDWASQEAMPSKEEIVKVRQLIAHITAGLNDLGIDERTRIDHAVETVRRHRTVALGMPDVRHVPLDLRPSRQP
ncbi:site-specific integrase [Ferrimicrobium sp.]|uniref:site-specific integrase n=1 Tax=Ferrimicrobium sp. TaxID=2926050 RepID=UPI0026374537|nr:site-specific integrase [Ferrimicrobium sp.]